MRSDNDSYPTELIDEILQVVESERFDRATFSLAVVLRNLLALQPDDKEIRAHCVALVRGDPAPPNMTRADDNTFEYKN